MAIASLIRLHQDNDKLSHPHSRSNFLGAYKCSTSWKLNLLYITNKNASTFLKLGNKMHQKYLLLTYHCTSELKTNFNYSIQLFKCLSFRKCTEYRTRGNFENAKMSKRRGLMTVIGNFQKLS